MMDMAGGSTWDIYGLTGVAAILLMLIHAVWATVVLVKKDEHMIYPLSNGTKIGTFTYPMRAASS